MKAVETSYSVTFEIETADDLATALDLMDPLALGLFDRDIASKADLPVGKCKVQVNAPYDDRVRAPSYVAGWLYVCATGFVYQLVVNPGSPEGGHWYKSNDVVLFNGRKDHL